jgi:hypothetical protein
MSATLEFRLLLYTVALKVLAANEMNYLDAFVEIRERFIRRPGGLMRALREAVRKYLAGQMGGTRTKHDLAVRLMELSKADAAYLKLCAGMLVALFAVSLVLTLLCRSNAAFLAAVSAFTGATVFGSIKAMSDLWREKVATDVLLAMVDHYQEDEFRLFVRGFCTRVFPAPPGGPGREESGAAGAPKEARRGGGDGPAPPTAADRQAPADEVGAVTP